MEHTSPIQSEEPYKAQARELWGEFEEKSRDYLKQHGKQGVENHWEHANPSGLGISSESISYGSGETVSMSGIRDEAGALFLEEFYGFRENLRAQYADKVWQIRKAYLDENPNRQSLLALNISRTSPAAVYYNAAAVLAETDLGSSWRFMEQARQYRQEWVEYLRDEKIFSSRRWFTGKNSEDPLDLTGMPRFKERSESIGDSLQRALPDIMILAVLNILFFMGAFISFLRYDL